jgi:tape measure domain-containing protein
VNRLEIALAIKLENAKSIVNDLADSMQGLGKQAQATGEKLKSTFAESAAGSERLLRGVKGLGGAVTFAFLVGQIRQVGKSLLDAAEASAVLQTKLKLVSANAEELSRANAAVQSLSIQNSAPQAAVAASYARVTRAVKDMGGAQSDAIGLTEALTLSLKINGGTTAENASVMQQFSQALGSGQLNGDELKSILENNAPLAAALAKGLGVTVSQLKDLGSQGELTSDLVAQSLLKSLTDLREQARLVPKTIESSTTDVSNAFQRWVATSRVIEQFRQVVIRSLQAVAENFDLFAAKIATVGTIVGAVVGLKLVGLFASALVSIKALAAGSTIAAIAVTALSGPIGVAAAAVTGAIAVFAAFYFWLRRSADTSEELRTKLNQLGDKSDLTNVSKTFDAAEVRIKKLQAAEQVLQQQILKTEQRKLKADKGLPLELVTKELNQQRAELLAVQKDFSSLEAGLLKKRAELGESVGNVFTGGFAKAKASRASEALNSFAADLKTSNEKLADQIARIRSNSLDLRNAQAAIIRQGSGTAGEKNKAIEAFNRQEIARELDLVKRAQTAGAPKSSGGPELGRVFAKDKAEIALLRQGLNEQIDLIKESLSETQSRYEQSYADGLIGLNAYFDARLNASRRAITSEVNVRLKLIAGLREELAQIDKFKPRDAAERSQLDTRRLQLTNEIAEAQSKINKAEVEGVRQAAKYADEKARARKELELQTLEIKNDLLAQTNQQTAEQQRQLLLARNAPALAKARAVRDETGDDSLLAARTQLIDIEVDKGSLARVQREISKVYEQLQLDEARLRSQGFDGEAFDARIRTSRERASSEIGILITILQGLAVNAKNIDVEIDVEQAKIRLAELQRSGVNLGNALENSLSSGFSEFFSTIVTDIRGVGDAFQKLGASIVKTVTDIIAKKLASKLVESLFSGAGSGTGGSGNNGGGLGGFFGALLKSYFGSSGAERLASGGAVRGPGGPRSDVIPAWLSNGEYVINAAAVKRVGLGYLDAINGAPSRALSAGLGLASGGLIDVPAYSPRDRAAVTQYNTIEITSPTPQAWKESEGQFAARMRAVTDRGARNR